MIEGFKKMSKRVKSNYNRQSQTVSRRKRRNRKAEKRNKIGWVVSIIQLVLTILLAALVVKLNVLPGTYTVIIIVLFFLLFALCRFMMGKGKNKFRFYAGMVIAIIISIAMCFADVLLYSVNSTLQNITNVEKEVTSVNVYVLNDDAAQTVSDAADYQFGILEVQGREDTDNAIEQINIDLSKEIAVTEYADAFDLAQGLIDQQCKAVIMTESFVEMLDESEEYDGFAEEVRVIGTYTWESIIKSTVIEEEKNEDVFTMYISGIDTAGSISKKSRSDVNIIAIFNKETHQVQLISTPRDYYVPLSISNGVKDKLTHAGIYGVDVSMDTLEMLYDTEIDYYFRVNFSGFQTLIDALGGVTVNSEVSFSVGDYHFVKGQNTLSGEEALIFARERKSFASGDRQRGKNQMAVITGVIAKMQTPAVLQNFTGLMEGLEGSFESNIPYSLLSELVKDQLSGGESWNVSTYSVDGSGKTASMYSLSKPNYVMEPDMETVEHAKELIQAVKDGEILDGE